MKKNPVKNINTPGYPTLEQLKTGGPKYPISKVAAVTALTAVMALSAAGCGEDSAKHKGVNFLGKVQPTEPTYMLMGDTETETQFVLDGETTVDTTPWELDGEVADTTPELDIQGGEAVYTEMPTDYTLSGEVEVTPSDKDSDGKVTGDIVAAPVEF